MHRPLKRTGPIRATDAVLGFILMIFAVIGLAITILATLIGLWVILQWAWTAA